MDGDVGAWLRIAELALITLALLFALLAAPWRIRKFFVDYNSDKVMYPTSVLRDMVVLLLFSAAFTGSALAFFSIIFDVDIFLISIIGERMIEAFFAVMMLNSLILIPLWFLLFWLSRRAMRERLERERGAPLPEVDRIRLDHVHSWGQDDFGSRASTVLPLAVAYVINYALFRTCADYPEPTRELAIVAWVLPVGLAVSSMRLFGVRI